MTIWFNYKYIYNIGTCILLENINLFVRALETGRKAIICSHWKYIIYYAYYLYPILCQKVQNNCQIYWKERQKNKGSSNRFIVCLLQLRAILLPFLAIHSRRIKQQYSRSPLLYHKCNDCRMPTYIYCTLITIDG